MRFLDVFPDPNALAYLQALLTALVVWFRQTLLCTATEMNPPYQTMHFGDYRLGEAGCETSSRVSPTRAFCPVCTARSPNDTIPTRRLSRLNFDMPRHYFCYLHWHCPPLNSFLKCWYVQAPYQRWGCLKVLNCNTKRLEEIVGFYPRWLLAQKCRRFVTDYRRGCQLKSVLIRRY
jgi:hypothetical protein